LASVFLEPGDCRRIEGQHVSGAGGMIAPGAMLSIGTEPLTRIGVEELTTP
jgi:hypothetical protein